MENDIRTGEIKRETSIEEDKTDTILKMTDSMQMAIELNKSSMAVLELANRLLDRVEDIAKATLEQANFNKELANIVYGDWPEMKAIRSLERPISDGTTYTDTLSISSDISKGKPRRYIPDS